jgi:hypothetical protein
MRVPVGATLAAKVIKPTRLGAQGQLSYELFAFRRLYRSQEIEPGHQREAGQKEHN